jgi:hypothetical protein
MSGHLGLVSSSPVNDVRNSSAAHGEWLKHWYQHSTKTQNSNTIILTAIRNLRSHKDNEGFSEGDSIADAVFNNREYDTLTSSGRFIAYAYGHTININSVHLKTFLLV